MDRTGTRTSEEAKTSEEAQTEARGLVAITGATGFIGGHLAAELAGRGWRVRALVRSMPRWHGLAAPPLVEAVPGSLDDAAALEDLVAGSDAVVHLAGAIKGRDGNDFLRANADGTAALARAWAARAPGARFVKVSSLAAREPSLSHYAASKRAAEERLAEIAASIDAAGGGRWQVLRPAAVYGPGDRETLGLFRAAAGPVQPMLGGPRSRLALVHVADLVRAIAALIEAELAPGMPGIHEVADHRPEGYSWEEIARAAAAALGRPARPLRLPGPAVRALGLAGDAAARLGVRPMLTSGKAREILHADWGSAPGRQLPPEIWRPRVPIDAGFAEAVAWYRAAGWLRQ